MQKIKRLVLATDFSPAGQRAVDYAISLAKAMEVPLEVLHVFDNKLLEIPLPYYPAGSGAMDRFIKEGREKGKEHLQKMCESLDVECQPHFAEGDPAKQVVQFTQDNDVDMLIMGSHGYTGLERLVIGSVTEYVVRQAHCPVLVVKQDK